MSVLNSLKWLLIVLELPLPLTCYAIKLLFCAVNVLFFNQPTHLQHNPLFFQHVMEGGSVFKYINVSKLYPGYPRSMHCYGAYTNVCVCGGGMFLKRDFRRKGHSTTYCTEGNRFFF